MSDSITHANREPLLEVTNLRIGFRAEHSASYKVQNVVNGVSLRLAPGERLGIVGESGSGKSLTGRALLGLLPNAATWHAQTLRFDGQDLLSMSRAERRALCGAGMSMVLQDPKYSLNPVMTVAQQLAEALRRAQPGLRGAALNQAIIAALDAVHIHAPQHVARAYPHELSGGMGQRVMIAMMVSTGPRLLIADEPTSALDVLVSMQVLRVLDEMIEQHRTGLIFISHDLPLVASFCDRVAVMLRGEIVDQCDASDLHPAVAHQRHPYTQALLAASPRLDSPLAVVPEVGP